MVGVLPPKGAAALSSAEKTLMGVACVCSGVGLGLFGHSSSPGQELRVSLGWKGQPMTPDPSVLQCGAIS